MLVFFPVTMAQNEKTYFFGVFKCKYVINLYRHVAQWGIVNKRSNVLATGYY